MFNVIFGDGSKDKSFDTAKEARARIQAIRNARVATDEELKAEKEAEKEAKKASKEGATDIPTAASAAHPPATHKPK